VEPGLAYWQTYERQPLPADQPRLARVQTIDNWPRRNGGKHQLAGAPAHREKVTALQARRFARIVTDRDAELLPDDDAISRSLIYLTPGRGELHLAHASIRRFRNNQHTGRFRK